MTDCLVFDLFGTLVEYEAGRTKQDFSASFDVARLAGCSAAYEDYVKTWDDSFRDLEREASAALSEFHMHDAAGRVISRLGINTGSLGPLAKAYIDDWSRGVEPITGAAGMLKRLSAHYRLALISNTHYPPMVHALLEKLDPNKLFETITLSVDFGKAKPHPGIFEHTLRSLGVAAAQAVYIGDNYEHDYVGARNAGMDCYLIGKHARVPRQFQLRSILDLPVVFDTSRPRR